MAARAIWKGILHVGEAKLPVKLYSAVQDRDTHFHLLAKEPDGSSRQIEESKGDAEPEARARQGMVNAETGEEVARGDIQKGYEVEPGVFVTIKPEELAALEPPPSRDIELTRFVEKGSIGSLWYQRPYYLGPDGDAATYFALVEALEKTGREGVAHWVMRKKQYNGALRVADGYLALITLHYAGEVVKAQDLPRPAGSALDKREVEMAKQLVAMLEGEFNPAEFKDEYRERLQEFLEAKAAGRKPKLKTVKMRKAPESLAGALQASLAAIKGKAVA